MKRVVSVSLGSSRRNHSVEAEFLGEKFQIERIGTDGDMELAISLIRELDGKVDAFGMGGIDLYLYAGGKRYTLRDARRIANAAKKTPIVDGSGLKNTLERMVIEKLAADNKISFHRRKVLLVSGVDRFGMAEALNQVGAEVIYGDLIFGLGIPIPLRSLKTLNRAARCLIPIISRLPFSVLYPTGKKQEQVVPKYASFYQEAEIIAGDFLFIRHHLPERMNGQTIITNTVTAEDLELLRSRGIASLITTTPELGGRSFGTNVMEGVLVSLLEKHPDEIKVEEYSDLLNRLGLEPRIIQLIS
ncbi:MAG: quinate 5-dehydrogenase [Syntrophomonadaceae bacterium]|nr:quinate 5-dehydrogenase [Syntrophomonadaceae bacterium]